jgi:4a-hydroxytetrahydrobiopterin dehydratase
VGFLFNIYFMRKFSNVVFENYQNLSWTVLDGKLQKAFKFDNFDKAIEFINKVAELSKSENHHPEILNIYNQVTISLFTHDQNKITELDQEMSKKIDDLFNI